MSIFWNKVRTKMKNLWMDFYCLYGYRVGKFMLKYTLYALVIAIVLLLLTGVFSLKAILEMILVIPYFAIVAMIIGAVLSIFHAIIPLGSGIIKLIIDFVIISFVIGGLGEIFSLDTDSQLLLCIVDVLSMAFGIIYYIIMIVLLKAPVEE